MNISKLPYIALGFLLASIGNAEPITIGDYPVKRFPFGYSINGGKVKKFHNADEFAGGYPRVEYKLSRKLDPGTYQLYCRFSSVGNGVLELRLGDSLKILIPQADSQKYCGPLTFTTTIPAENLEILPRTDASLAELYLLPEGEPFTAPLLPMQQPEYSAVWVDFGTGEYPWWYAPDAPRSLRFQTIGTGKAAGKIQILDYDHKIVKEQTFLLDLASPEPVQLPQTPAYGPYLIKCTLEFQNRKKIEFQMVYAIILPDPSNPCPLLGGHGNEPFLVKMGASRERLWDMNNSVCGWSVMNSEGKFDFSKIVLPEKLQPMVVLDRMPRNMQPTFQNPENYYRYVDAVTKHLKGKTEYYEILNEPYLTREWTSDFNRYAQIIRETAAIIRRNDPEVKIATGGPTPEVSPGIDTWKSMLAAGIFDSVDVISGHFYLGGGGIHPIDKDYSLQEFLDTLRPLLEKHGQGNKMLLDTESGLSPNESFLLGGQMVYGLSGSVFTEREPVAYQIGTAMYVRQYLIHRVNRVLWYLYHTCGDRGNSWSLTDFRNNAPLPAGVALAQTVRMLEGYEPDTRPDFPKGIFGCRFKKGNQSAIVFWGLEMLSGETRPFRCANRDKVTILDLFGNPAAKDEAGLSPLFIFGSITETDAFLKSLTVRSQRDLSKISKQQELSQMLDNRAASETRQNQDGDTEVILSWQEQQEIEWIEVAWKMGSRPEKYHVSYRLPDGNWRYVQGTWQGWRKLRIERENFPIHKIKTNALRLVWHNAEGSTAELECFRPYQITRLTPPVTEMQEVFSREFKPDSNGFIRDFLLCGPFPSSGKRQTNQKPTDWDSDFIKDHYHYGSRWNHSNLIPKVDQRHIAEFPENSKTNWKTGKAALHWFPWHSPSALTDMAEAFKSVPLFNKTKLVESCYGYAFTILELDKPFSGKLAVGSDDGYRIWLDKKIFCEKIAYRSSAPDQESYPVKLDAGIHYLMIRLHNDIGGHGFYLRFLDNTQQPFTNYTVKLIEKTWGK